jgi:stromal membrane-associated protein
MGTHISRVKSVDLDAWTDEQLQSVLRWGNTRANKYWEAKLAPGHTPSEAKIENFIRTKYESKRWIMDGPMPDPSTLDADDDVPLNLVQEKAKIERSASQRLASPQKTQTQRVAPAPSLDLFGDIITPPVRPNTADIPGTKPTRTGPPAPKPSKPQESLLGLDFFGGSQPVGIGRPSSAASNPAATANARGDLKNSILSLYATAPKPAPAQSAHDHQPSFGGITSPSAQPKDAFGGLADAFGGMTFSSQPAAKPPLVQSPPSALGGMTSFLSTAPAKATPAAPQVTSPPPLSGGSFFDMTPTNPPAPKPANAPRQPSKGLDFSFTQKAKPVSPPIHASAPAPAPVAKPATNVQADLFSNDDFGGWASTPAAPAPAPAPAPKMASPAMPLVNDFGSAFNLSSQPKPTPTPVSQSRTAPVSQNSNAMFDPWSSAATDSSPWGAPEPAPAKPAAPSVDLGRVPSRITPNDISGGWGAPISNANKSTAPTVAADEDFGGWTSASTTQTPATNNPPRTGGFGAASDPFDNPWG